MNDLLKDEDIWGAATAPESPTLSDADIWGGPAAPAAGEQNVLSDADIWGDSTTPAMPQSGYRKEAGPLYDADNPPYAEDQFIKAKKVVNGKEYRLHGPTGVIYDENNRAVVAPDVLKAFGRDKPNKLAQSIYDANQAMPTAPSVPDRKIIDGREYRLGKDSGIVFDDKNKIVDDPQIRQAFGIDDAPGVGDYAAELGKSTVRGVAGAASSAGKGLGVLTSDNAAEIARVEEGIANLKSMTAEEATAFMRELPSKLSPAVAFNYQVAIRKLWRDDVEGAKPYLEQARKYIDTRPVEEQGLTVAGKQLEEATNEAFPQDPRFKGSITSDIGQAAGSSLFFLPIGLLTGGTGVAVAGAAAGAAESYDTAKGDIQNGNFRDDRGGLFNAGYGTAAETAALGAGRLGALPGASEVVPTEIFLEQMPKYIPGLRTIANTPAWGRFAKAFGRVGTQVLSEGGQEAFQTWAGNLINQLKINPSQDITEDVLYNALLGGIVGGGMQTGVEGYNAVFGKDAPAATNGGPVNVSPQAPQPGQRIDPTLFPNQQAAPQPGAPPAEAPISDDAWLMGAGYTPEQIDDMNPEERAAAVEEAQAQGVEPVDLTAGAPAPGTAPMAPRGTRRDRVNVQSEQDLEAVRPTVNAEPSEAQAAAGNYQKGHVKLHGFDVSIENPRGSVRRGKDEDGKDWASPELPADYGYIKGTKGKDGDHVDVYIGSQPESDRVYVIDQHSLKSGEFDEHKAVLGAASPQEAVDLYVNSFDNPTYDRIGDVTEMSVDDFRQWVQNRRNTKKPAAAAGVGTVVQRPAPGTAPMAPRAPRPDPAAEAAATTAKLKAQGLTDQQIQDLSWEEVQRLAQAPAPTVADDFDSIFQQELDAEYGPSAPAPAAAPQLPAKPRNRGPINVLDFIASIGGISDPTGELAGMDLPRMTKFGPVLRKTGLHPDKVREALVEAGLLYDRGRGTDLQAETTPNDVFDLIARHMGGDKVYTPQDQAKADANATTRAAEAQNPDLEGVHPIVLRWGQEVWDQVQAVLELQGLDEDAWSPQEVNDAARMISEGMDPEQAFERAYATHVAELDDMPEIAPEIAAAFEKNRANAMVVFDPPPFPDVETADNAAQQQDLPEAGDGLDADGEAGPDPRGEAEVRGAGPESAGAGPDGAEAGSAEFSDEEVSLDDNAGRDAIDAVGGAKPAAEVFPPPEKTYIASATAGTETITPEEAEKRLEEWKAFALEQGSTTENNHRVILSLFDYTGTWSQPYVDAGFTVIQYDIQHMQDREDYEPGDEKMADLVQWFPIADILEIRNAGYEIYGVLSACPCTTFAGSGARWWEGLHDVNSREAVEKVFGDWVPEVFESPVEYNKMLEAVTQTVVEFANPTGFHVLENPVGRIARMTGLPAPLLRFNPHHYGDPYTKKTQLWGDFSPELPTANVEPTEGSKVHKLRGDNPDQKRERSTTPSGFAYAFFMANNPRVRPGKVIEGAPEFDPSIPVEVDGVVRKNDDSGSYVPPEVAVAGEDGWLISSNENGVFDSEDASQTITENFGKAKFTIEVFEPRAGQFIARQDYDIAQQAGGVSPASTSSLEPRGYSKGAYASAEEAIAHEASILLMKFERVFRGRDVPAATKKAIKQAILKLKELGATDAEDAESITADTVIEEPAKKARAKKEPAAEKGADAKEQLVIPGAERDQKGALNNAAKAPLKGSKPQQGMDVGLFGSERDQTDMFDQPAPKKAEAKADTGLAQQIRDKFVIFSSGMSRFKDFLSGAYTTGTLSTRGIGVDVQELSDNQIKPMAKKIVEWQTQVFVDSGAFGVFKRNLKERVKYENALIDLFEREGAEAPELEEISDAQLLTRYDQIANALSAASSLEGEADYPQPLYVAPDIVGDQAGSIALVKKHAKWINLRLDGGRQIIVPIQKGEKNLAEAFEAVAEILGRRDFIVGVPSNAKAVTDAEFAAFVKAAKPPKLHFLGTTDPAKIEPRIEAIAAAGYVPDHVSSDANMLRALLYGRSDVEETRDEGIRRVIKDKSPEFEELAGGSESFDDVFAEELDAAFDVKPQKANLQGNWWEPLMGGEEKPKKKGGRSAGQAAKSAAKNTAKGMGEIVQGLEALFGSKNKLSSGFTFDEESYAKALPLFKAAVTHLGEAVSDMREVVRALIKKFREAGMSRDALEGMQPYLKRFAEDVTAGKISLAAEEPAAEQGAQSPFHPLVVAFVDYLSQPDAGFDTITEARKFARDRGFDAKPGTPEAKDLDEKLELAIVLTARTLVGASKKRPPVTAYRRLVDLYNRQPNLGVRTSESMADQAYSTPAPLAFIASRLAGVAGAKSVMEPTAGNGMLLLEADPQKATVNELNDRRAAALSAQGFRVTQKDAATESLRHAGYPIEAIIENPPFGAVMDKDGGSKTFTVDGWNTTQIDHAIALNTLKSLADTGRAVLIVGSVKEGTDKTRSDSYNTKQKREFYWRLYQGYNVVDHFTVAGDLYKRQGAAWPVDVIVIDGRGKSARPLPAVELPKFYDTWEALEEKLNEAPAQPDTGTGQEAGGAAVSGPAGLRDGAENAPRVEAGSRGNRPAADVGGAARLNPEARGQAPVSDGSNLGEPAGLGEQQSREPDGGEVSTGARDERDGDRQPAAAPRERVKQEAGAAQQTYKPMSGLKALDTNIPTNMADAVEQSLKALAEEYGDLDRWIEKELGYKKGELGNYLAAEQVDAVALAIHNVKKNAAFIIGDQTGIGKGRVVASALRYAMRNRLVPIFVTEKPNLYGDIIRDLNDIGVPQMLGRDLKPFLTNAGASIPLDDEAVAWYDEAERAKVAGNPAPEKRGKFLRASGGDLHKRQMAALQKDGTGKDFDIIFTTYDQLNTVKGQPTDRRRLVEGLADRSFMVLDESHNAGGTEASERAAKDAPESRSDFLKKMTGKAKAVMFSSATYAKRPGVMALYARTDMGKAVEKPEMLGALIERGGVPMQQVVAAMLAKAGQYIRRERSFDGVSYDVEPVTVDLKAYEAVSTSLSAIAQFDMALKKGDTFKEIKENLKESAEAAAMDSGTGSASVSSTNFTSLMHNIVNQMLLAIKTDAVASRAIEALKAGEKPVITVANTMGAFLKTYAEEHDLKRSDAVDLSFRDVLSRYLERTRRLTIKRPDNTTYHYMIPLSALPGDLLSAYREAERLIGTIDTANLPISPIDWLRFRIQQAGYRVSEITGRKEILEYGGPDNATFAQRLDSEVSPAGRRVNIDKFNRGDLDVMILNRAGSTGLSLHASSKFKDQRRRRMIIAQAELNIDVHMQMLGRVHRTGQVIPPAFVQAYADVPAEARPAAVLAKKMASLNANTTASRKSAFSADDSVDFLNEYGDQIAREYLAENPGINELLDVSLDPEKETARELTGRLLLLPVAQQRAALDDITARYKVLIENLDAMGENALEAKTIDLEAKTVNRQDLKPAEGDSPFTQAVVLEQTEVKSQGKALPLSEIIERAAEALGAGKVSTENPESALNELERVGRASKAAHYKKWYDDFDRMAADEIKVTKNEDLKTKRREALNENRYRFTRITDLLMAGRRVVVKAKDGSPLTGIVMKVSRRGQTGVTGNPLALGAWSAEIAIPDNAQRITVPFSSLALPGDTVGEAERKVFVEEPDWANGVKQTVEAFENARKTGKETRYIVTGNILAGFDQTKGQGQIINYTDDQGNVKPGILMSKTFSPKAFLESRAVRFKTAAQVLAFLDKLPDAEIMSHDDIITVRKTGAWVEVEMPAARQSGGTYFLNPDVRKAASDTFTKVGSRMRYKTNLMDSAQKVLDAMMTAGAVFQTTDQQDAAEEIITGKKPEARKQAPLSSRAQGRLSSAKAKPVFYSGLLRAVEGLKLETAPKAQWMGTIRNAPGVKAEEIAWVGLEGWLAEQGGQITKKQIADFIRANQVEVKEVLKERKRVGGYRSAEDYRNRLWEMTDEELADEIVSEFGFDREEALQDAINEPEAMMADLVVRYEQTLESRGSGTDGFYIEDDRKWSKHQLPGGENYRELLLTLPEKDAIKISGTIMVYADTDADGILTDISAEGMEELDYGRDTDEAGNEQIYFENLNPADLAKFEEIATRNGGHVVIDKKEGSKETYRSGHWDEPNVLAHVRFNERMVDGKKVLFIEEIQSDWHQSGRKRGYKRPLPKDEADALMEERRQLLRKNDPRSAAYNELTAAQVDANHMRIEEINARFAATSAVPDAPFKTTWPELAMKRMIRWAAENGFDRIAWTPGEVQAERYDLSRQVSSIKWSPSENFAGQTYVSIDMRNGGTLGFPINEKGQVTQVSSLSTFADQFRGKTIDDVVGKEIGEKILNSAQGELKGDGLKVGGAGMIGFYDKMLVDVANKLGKKWGAKVGKLSISTNKDIPSQIGESAPERVYFTARGTAIVDPTLDIIYAQPLRHQAVNDLVDYWVGEGVPRDEAFRGVNQYLLHREEHALRTRFVKAVPSLDIPAEMKAAAMEGQPLFKRREQAKVPTEPKPTKRNPYRFVISQKQSAALVHEIGQIAERILGHRLASISIVTDQEAWNETFGPEEDAVFDPNTGIIYLALHGTQDLRSTLRHEAVHALRQAGVIRAQEWAVLSRMAQTRWIDQYKIRSRYEQLYRERFDITDAEIEQLLIEEAVADAMAEHWTKAPTEDVVGRIFARIKAFLAAVRAMLLRRGYTSAEEIAAANQILDTIERGGMSARREGTGQGRDFMLYARQSEQAPLSSRRRLSPPQNPTPGSFEAPHDERVLRALTDSTDSLLNRLKRAGRAFGTEFRRKAQDREVDLLRTQNAIEQANGGPLAEPRNAYLAASLYPGRVAQRDKDLIDDVIEPLVKDIARRGLSLEEVNDFVMARHAIERNLEVGQLHKPGSQFHEAMTNPAIVGASGMSENNANDILNDAQASGKFADLEAVGDEIVAMNRRTLAKLYAEGLITQEQYDALTQKYQYYVPLRGWDDVTDDSHPDTPKTGRRYDVRGPEFQQALGRTSKADSPLAYSIMQARQAVIRIEKNRVGKRFLRLAQANPNAAFWEVNRVDLKRIVDPKTGFVRNIFDRGATEAENVYAVKVGGKRYNITLHHEGLLRAMKGIGGENMGDLVGVFHKINRFFAMMNTQLDPEFIFRNFLRDIQQAGIVIQEEKAKGLTRKIIAAIPKAAYGMNQMLQGKVTSQWARYAREFADAGGKIGFMDRADIEIEKRNLERLMKEATAGWTAKTLRAANEQTLERLARYNDSIENTLRLSTYVALRQAGATKDRAAFVARELTVNFNRKGEWGPALNAFYLFYNASMQGAASLFMRLGRSRKMKMVAAGLIVEAFLMDMLNRMIGGDDDDEKNRYDKIPQEEKARNHIFMMPKWFEEKYGTPYYKVPLPLGWNWFNVIGQQASSAVAGAVTPLEAFGTIAGTFADSFNPLGSGDFLSTVTPTLLDPLLEIARNKDFFGENITPRQFDETTPNSERYKPNVSPEAKWLTDTFSRLTGGSPERSGAIDISPEWVEHLTDFALGGLGRFFTRSSNSIQSWVAGEDIDTGKIPFRRVFEGRDSTFADRDEYFQIRDAVHVTEKELRARIAEKNPEAAAEVRRKYGREIKMMNLLDAAEKQLTKLRKDYKAVKNSQKMGEEARAKRLEAISQRMDEIQRKVRTKWHQLGEDVETSPSSGVR